MNGINEFGMKSFILFFFLVGLKFIMVSIFFIFYNIILLLIKCIKVDNIICNFRSKLELIINKYMYIFVSEFV